MSEQPKFSYEARRFLINISVEINDDNVGWTYSNFGNTWNHTIPLSTLEPFPTFTESQFGMRIATALFPIATFAIIVLFTVVGWSNVTIAIGLLTFAAFPLWAAVGRIRGPIRWAHFDSEYANKQVCFFQGRDVDEFETFAEQISTLVSNSQMAKASSVTTE